MDILQKISKKGSDKEEIAEQIIKNPKYLSDVYEGLNTNKATIKYGCEKVIRAISEKKPELLYPKFDIKDLLRYMSSSWAAPVSLRVWKILWNVGFAARIIKNKWLVS